MSSSDYVGFDSSIHSLYLYEISFCLVHSCYYSTSEVCESRKPEINATLFTVYTLHAAVLCLSYYSLVDAGWQGLLSCSRKGLKMPSVFNIRLVFCFEAFHKYLNAVELNSTWLPKSSSWSVYQHFLEYHSYTLPLHFLAGVARDHS